MKEIELSRHADRRSREWYDSPWISALLMLVLFGLMAVAPVWWYGLGYGALALLVGIIIMKLDVVISKWDRLDEVATDLRESVSDRPR